MKLFLEEEWKIARLNNITGNLEYIHSNSVLKLYLNRLKQQPVFLVQLPGRNNNYHLLLERYQCTKAFRYLLSHILVRTLQQLILFK